jgi:hypothetical protein
LYEILEKYSNKNDALKNKKQNFLVNYYIVILMNYFTISKTNKQKIKPNLLKWRYLLNENVNYRIKKIVFLNSFITFNQLIFLLNSFRVINSFFKRYRFIGKYIRVNKG